MNIQDFVSESLRQIGAGVVAGASHPGIEVSPRATGGAEVSASVGHLRGPGGRFIVFVEFDLSVLVQAKVEGEAGGGITVFGMGGKAEVSSGIDQTRTQRVKFHVPIMLKPRGETDAA